MNKMLSTYVVFSALFPVAIHAETMTAQEIYKKVLPSTMTLNVVKKDGTSVLGTGFMAIKDGMALTAWHVVKNATTVTAKFSDGEEFDASGLIDKDEKRDLALIKIKVSGRGLLALSPKLPDIGVKAYVIGAPRGLEFSISDGLVSQIQNDNGMKLCQFTCPASPGNSGGPLIDSNGIVIGVVSRQYSDGQNLNFAVPSTYALGLDSTLPTQPWDTVKNSEPVAVIEIPKVEVPKIEIPHAVNPSDEDLDRLFAKCLITQIDFRTEAAYIDEHIVLRRGGSRDGVPTDLYVLQKDAQDEASQLANTMTADPARDSIRHRFYDEMVSLSSYAANISTAINFCDPLFGWTPLANDYLSKAGSDLQRASAMLPSDLVPVRNSPFFQNLLPDLLTTGSSAELLGAGVWLRNDLFFVVVPKGSTAEKMGLNTSDKVVSVEGKSIFHLHDFYLETKKHLGQKMKITVIRDGKTKDFDSHVPQSL